MKGREERKYFDKEWMEMKASLKSFLKTMQQEDLHRFRIQVKKIRALLILLESAAHKPKLTKYFIPVRKVFKQAGEIRSAYINLKISKAHQFNSELFVTGQYGLMEKAIIDFIDSSDKNLKEIENSHKALKGRIQPVSNLHISLFYNDQLKKIADAFSQLQFDEGLHELRKRIKNLVYNHKLVHMALNTEFNKNYLDGIQTAIGDWHDNVLAIELFSLSETENETALNKLKKQHAKLEDNISAITNDFYNQATTTVEVPVEQLS
jgi:CHAD domain-containing protein